MIFSSDFTGWDVYQNGTGVATVSSGVLTASSTAGGGSAGARKALRVRPGDIIVARCMARVLTEEGPRPRIVIDFPTLGAAASYTELDAPVGHWAEYTVTHVVPLTAAETDYVAVAFGVFTAQGGSAEFAVPRINVDDSGFASPRLLACGLIRSVSGVVSLLPQVASCGIKSVALGPNGDRIIAEIDKCASQVALYPLIDVQLHALSSGPAGVGRPDYRPLVGEYDRTTGLVPITLQSLTNLASLRDVSGLNVYLYFKAYI